MSAFRRTPEPYNCRMEAVERQDAIATLLENHRAFLRYLERRVGDAALAEDILQDAFAKVVARPEQAPPDEAIVPWFYRTLRNAAVDQFRRRGAADRATKPSRASSTPGRRQARRWSRKSAHACRASLRP